MPARRAAAHARLAHCDDVAAAPCALSDRLPYSIRVLLESAIRNCDEFNVTSDNVEAILAWEETSKKDIEIPFKPARVVLQDFTYAQRIAGRRRRFPRLLTQ